MKIQDVIESGVYKDDDGYLIFIVTRNNQFSYALNVIEYHISHNRQFFLRSDLPNNNWEKHSLYSNDIGI